MKPIFSLSTTFLFILFGAFYSFKEYPISGYVYKQDKTTPVSGAKIELYTKPKGKGKKIISLISDKNGFFQSENAIDFTYGLYPSVTYNNKTDYMSIPAKTGNCIICHSKNRLTIK